MNSMEKDTFKTRAVLRRFKDGGDLLALFPDEDYGNGLIMSYQRVGQHSGADYTYCISASIPVSELEAKPLVRELESIGYNLQIIKRYRKA